MMAAVDTLVVENVAMAAEATQEEESVAMVAADSPANAAKAADSPAEANAEVMTLTTRVEVTKRENRKHPNYKAKSGSHWEPLFYLLDYKVTCLGSVFIQIQLGSVLLLALPYSPFQLR